MVGAVLTMAAGNQRIIAGQPFRLMPFADGAWRDFQTLLQWGFAPPSSPEAVAKARDAATYFAVAMRAYELRFNDGGVQHLVRQAQTGMSGEVVLSPVTAGEYMLISDYRGYRSDRATWCVRFRVEPGQATQVILDNRNAYLY